MIDELDRRLVERFQESREESDFRALYRRHTPSLFPIVLRLVGGRRDDAEEVVQETWIRAIEGLERYEGRSSLRTWMTGIAINCVRERWRREDRGPGVEPHLVVGAASLNDRIDHHTRIDLERAVDALPEEYRTVLVLHDIEGLTHEEIGRLIGTQASGSRTRLHRARRALRVRLAASASGKVSNA